MAAGEAVGTREGDIGAADGLAANPGYLRGESGLTSDVREGSFSGSALGAFFLRGFKEVIPSRPLIRSFMSLDGTLNLGVGERMERAKVLGENGDAKTFCKRSMIEPSIPNATAVGGGEVTLGVVGAAAMVATSLASALVALIAVTENAFETGESGLTVRPREAAMADLENMTIVSRQRS